jgi:hypothetical protein
MRSLVRFRLKQGACHGAPGFQGTHNEGCIRFRHGSHPVPIMQKHNMRLSETQQ